MIEKTRATRCLLLKYGSVYDAKKTMMTYGFANDA